MGYHQNTTNFSTEGHVSVIGSRATLAQTTQCGMTSSWIEDILHQARNMSSRLLTMDYHYCYISSSETTYKEEELSEPILTATGGYSLITYPYRLGIFNRIFTPQVYASVNLGSHSHDHFFGLSWNYRGNILE